MFVLLFLILAVVLAGLAAFGFAGGRLNLLAAGFCSFAIAVLIEHI